MKIHSAEFLLSASTTRQFPAETLPEIAFAGRSNAGKSSAINTLTNQKQLARASKRPGRTQMINFFTLGNPEQRLVDLPGYGYAAVPEEMKKVWQKELENYLIHRESLQGLVLLMDIRHPLQHFDRMMLEWAHARNLFVHILLTKADKLNRGPANKALLEVKKDLNQLKLKFSIQLFSSLDRQGLDELAMVMAGRLGFTITQSNDSNSDTENDSTQEHIQELDLLEGIDLDAIPILGEVDSDHSEK